uniref:Uncharacterized protein n=1 Tax=Glossina palpalis gambiensis TaxID=67801 RepID=A0A1B0B246_9MUSC
MEIAGHKYSTCDWRRRPCLNVFRLALTHSAVVLGAVIMLSTKGSSFSSDIKDKNLLLVWLIFLHFHVFTKYDPC